MFIKNLRQLYLENFIKLNQKIKFSMTKIQHCGQNINC